MLAAEIIKTFTFRVFDAPVPSETADEGGLVEEIDKLHLSESESETTVVEGEKDSELTSLSASPSGESIQTHLASSFELGQLIFLVGHVALKHIVYLELVERELKRRKDQRTTEGGVPFDELYLKKKEN